MTARPPDRGYVDYDYALVRYVPRPCHGVFLPVGVVVHARQARFLRARVHLHPLRLSALCTGLGAPCQLDVLERFLGAYARVAEGGAAAGPLGLLPPSERFHWLTAPRSAALQTSAVHPGRAADPAAALDELFERFVPA